jgi:AbiV family abortive infection protein
MNVANPAALMAIARNAARHLVEANQHYSGQRYPSALTSAIFAIEETGKLAIHSIGGEAPKSNQRHARHAILFYAMARMAEDLPSMLEWQRILRNGWTPGTTLTERQQRALAEHPEYADIVRRMQAGELSTLAERTQAFGAAATAKAERDGTVAKWQWVIEQGLNQMRIRATYVDVTDTGFTSPEATSAGQASAMCWFALALFLLQIVIAVSVGPLKGHDAEVANLLPEAELIGQADIEKFIKDFTAAASASPAATPE